MNKSMTELLISVHHSLTDCHAPSALQASGGVLNKSLRGTGESVPHDIVSRLERKNIFSVNELGIVFDSSVLPHHVSMFLTGSSTPYYISGVLSKYQKLFLTPLKKVESYTHLLNFKQSDMLIKRVNVHLSFCMCLGIIVLSLLSSCSQCTRTVLTNIGMNIENYHVHNIYSTMDMSIFHGFESKISLKELQAAHGKPNRILDAKEVADIDNYNIWEYNFQHERIDCYVRNNDSIVDYIYCEFTTPRTINSIVKNKDIANEIIKNKSFADYIVDNFKTTIRILKQKGNNSHAINVALDDNTDLTDNEPLKLKIKKINERTPIQVADLCEISSIEYNKNTVSINCDISELSQEVLEKNPNFGLHYCIYLFGDKGLLSFLKPKLLERNVNINLVFKDKFSVPPFVYRTSARNLLNSPTTVSQRLNAIIAYDNMGLVNITNQESTTLRMEPREIQGNVVKISMTYKKVIMDTTESQYKKFVTNLFLDEKNPDQEMIILCAKGGMGICYTVSYEKDGIRKTYTADFSNRELKALLTQI